MTESQEKIENPTDHDVLLGRGKPFQNHPGNRKMLGLVDQYRERYQRAERKEKHDIVEEVMELISSNGGRFLRHVDYENQWVEVSHPISYRKVGHAFRSKARKTGGSKKNASSMGKFGVNSTAGSMEEMLLAEMRMRRAAMHQAELMGMQMGVNMNMNNMNMNNFPSLAGASGTTALDRLLLNQGLNPGFNPSLYNGLAQGLVGGGMDNLLRQQQSNLLANTALLGNGLASNTNDSSTNAMAGSALPNQQAQQLSLIHI